MKSHAALLLLLVSGQAAAGISPGSFVESVVCEAAPEFSYALYLPSGYDVERAWPLILAFDPSGIGSQPVEGFRAAAERYGYIAVGSNDSRNYTGWEPKMAAAAAVWKDVAGRFSIDAARVYTAGFSGGARMATEVALQTRAVAGVFAVGAGFRERDGVDGPIPFVFAAASGTRDMNHREMQQVHARLLERELPSLHVVFDGPHQWPPKRDFTAAIEWFEVQAMRRGLRAVDREHVGALLDNARNRAQAATPPDAVLRDYEQITRDFAGLADLEEIEAEIRRLRQDPAVARAAKERKRLIRHEDDARRRLVTQIRKMELAVDDAGRRAGDLRDLRREIDRHVRNTDSEDPRRADTASRLVSFVSLVGYERGIHAGQSGDYERAALFYEIALQAVPESRGLHVRLAGMYARSGRADRALETLTEAIELGFDDAERLRSDEHLATLREDPRFAALLADLDPS